MASGTPYIGSKISLISKAEIRYEGILYDVDSKEATVTLSKVKSYGTETRQAPKQIPPRNDVYEYIIFRGSDIKDLTVSEMGNKEDHPVDPAIVSAQSTAPVSTSRSDPSTAINPSRNTGGGSSAILPTPHPIPPAGGYTQFPPGLGGYNPFGVPPYYGRPPMMMGQPLHPPHPMHPPLSNQQPHPPTPPTHISTISSGNNQSSSTDTMNRSNPQPLIANSPSESTPPVTTTVTTATHGISAPINQGFVPPSISLHSQSKTVPKSRPPVSTPANHHYQPTEQSTTPPNTSSNKKSNSPKHNKEEDNRPLSSPEEGRRQPKRGGRGQKQYNNNYTPSRGSRSMNTNWRGVRGEGRYPRNPRGGNNGGGGYTSNHPPSNPASQQPLKYTKDFDFESANALFSKDQLEKEMKLKLKLSDDQKEGGSDGGEPVSTEHDDLEEGELVRGDMGSENEDNNDEDEFYDKTKSFFDTISCESTQTNPNSRSNRSQEMALNTETFGVTNRGYSGRSRSHGWGYNPRYRGGRGYYNQYNGYNQYRGYRGGRGGYYGNSGGGNRGRRYDRGGYNNDYQTERNS